MNMISLLQKCFKKLDDPNCHSHYDEYLSKCIDDTHVAVALSFRTETDDDRKSDYETDTGE